MKVTVVSSLSGQASGHVVLSPEPSQTVLSLLDKFLTVKGATFKKSYVVRYKSTVLNLNRTLEECGIGDQDILILGLSDDEEDTFSYGNWWLITTFMFIISIVGLATTLWLHFYPSHTQHMYGVVMDAGSSHSELFAFSWPSEKLNGTGEVSLLHRCYIKGGISSYASHANDLVEYMLPCLQEMENFIPKKMHKHTPIYSVATAGMRILRDFDPEGTVAVLATLREVLVANSTLSVKPGHPSIIPGYSEGIAGWMAVNYLKSLKNVSFTASAAIDVGGASTQITTINTDPESYESYNVTLFNTTHSIASQSYLCYGVGQALNRYNYLLVANTHENLPTENDRSSPALEEESSHASKDMVVDSCLPSGLKKSISKTELWGPCTKGKHFIDKSTPPRNKKFSNKLHRTSSDSDGNSLDSIPNLKDPHTAYEIGNRILIGRSNSS